jgi:hypothetical protein
LPFSVQHQTYHQLLKQPTKLTCIYAMYWDFYFLQGKKEIISDNIKQVHHRHKICTVEKVQTEQTKLQCDSLTALNAIFTLWKFRVEGVCSIQRSRHASGQCHKAQRQQGFIVVLIRYLLLDDNQQELYLPYCLILPVKPTVIVPKC